MKQMRSEASVVGQKLARAGGATRTPGKMTALQGVSGTEAGGGGGGRYDAAEAISLSARQIARCLAHLDGVSEAKAFFRYHSRSEVRGEWASRSEVRGEWASSVEQYEVCLKGVGGAANYHR